MSFSPSVMRKREELWGRDWALLSFDMDFKEAECPLCTNTLNNPRTLPCLHSFCLGCLDKRANLARRQRQHAIECSVCQSSLQIPETDTFANLPIHVNRQGDVLTLEEGTEKVQKCSSCDKNNLLTSYCLVCQSFVCAPCSDSQQCFNPTNRVVIDKPQNQDVQQLIERPFMCSQHYHQDQPLEFYCEDCKVLICLKCSIVSHNRHVVIDTQKAAKEKKMQMAEAVDRVKAEILVYENEIKKQTELKNKNMTDIKNAEKKMTCTVEGLIRDLREHERKMKGKFRDIYEAEQKQYATRLEKLELITTKLKSFVERGLGIVARNMSAEILQTNPAIIERSDELLNARKPDVYKSPYLDYLVEKKFDLLDQILVTRTDPSMCLAEGHDSETGKESKFVVITRDSEGLQCYQEDDQIKVDILTPEGDHLRTELKDSKDGKYIVTYTPQCVGQHRVEIQVNAQLLTGSPACVVEVRRQHQYQGTFKFGRRGKRPGKFRWIANIAVSKKAGTIAVADYLNKRIQLFSADGKFEREVRLNCSPISVAFTDRGDLMTLESRRKNKLRVFSEEGQFIKHINEKHLKKPIRLSLDGDGRLIITDTEVKVLSPDGNDLLLSFTAPDCAAYPECAIYHQSKFFVSYPGAHCVKVFNKTGVYLHDIGCKGSNDGQFDCPVGLVIDNCNRLIVCDVKNDRLQLFTLSGKFLSKLQGRYFKNNNPAFAAINNNDKNLFVAGWSSIYVFH